MAKAQNVGIVISKQQGHEYFSGFSAEIEKRSFATIPACWFWSGNNGVSQESLVDLQQPSEIPSFEWTEDDMTL